MVRFYWGSNNYESLNNTANEVAETMIENLARSAVLNGKQVDVLLFDDDENPDIVEEE